MRGIHLRNPGELELEELDWNISLLEDEVKIKLIYGGICGSDIGVYNGKIQHAKYPVRPGHELVGRILEAGKNVTFAPDTKVVITPNTFCGECDNCLNGHKNICIHKQSLGVNVDGIFSEEIIINAKYVLPIPEEISDEEAVLVEPLAVIVHAFQKANIQKGTKVGVIGCGTEGMLTVALAVFLGAEVTAIDINPKKLENAKSSYNVNTLLAHEIQNETFDVVIEAAGDKRAVEQAIGIVKKGGKIILIGLTPEATLPIVQIVRNEITIHGSIIYNFPEDFSRSVGYLIEEKFNIKPVISKIFPLEEFKEAYVLAVSGQSGKILIDFKGDKNL